MTAEQNKAVARRYIDEILSQGMLAVADEILAEDFVMSIPGYQIQGIPAFKAFVTDLRTSFPDCRFTIRREAADDSGRVAMRWTQIGTHNGNLYDIPPTGKIVTDQGTNIFHVADGKVKGSWLCEDTLGVMRQVGAVPPAQPPTPTRLLQPAGPLPPVGAGDPAANSAIVHRYIQSVMSGNDVGAAPQVMAPDCVSDLPSLPGPLHGPEGWVRIVQILRTAIPDLATTIDDELATGDTVVVRWTSRGTNSGNLGPLPPSNKPVVIEGITWFRIANGMLVENLVNEDQLGLMRQIGAIAPARELTPGESRKLVHDFFEGIWNKSDYSLIDKYIAPNFVQHFPGAESSREGFRRTVKQFHDAFGEMNLVIEDEIVGDSRVVHRWTWNCTHTGSFAGIPPTGRKVSFPGVTIVRLSGGQIVEHWASLDTLGLLQQLGALPAPAAQPAPEHV